MDELTEWDYLSDELQERIIKLERDNKMYKEIIYMKNKTPPTYDTIDTKEIVSWLTNRVGTHFDGCWQYHPECLIVRLCNEIDKLRQERTALSLKLDECYKRIGEM